MLRRSGGSESSHYWGNYLSSGFHSPVLLQLVRELVESLPVVLSGHHLNEAWAYMYESPDAGSVQQKSEGNPGIGLHADNGECGRWLGE